MSLTALLENLTLCIMYVFFFSFFFNSHTYQDVQEVESVLSLDLVHGCSSNRVV